MRVASIMKPSTRVAQGKPIYVNVSRSLGWELKRGTDLMLETFEDYGINYAT